MSRRLSLVLLVLVGCAIDEHDGRTCEVDADCGEGTSCYRGFCVEEICTVDQERVCFDGDPGLVDPVAIGSCRQGLSTCGEDERWGACVGQVLPRAEACNGDDDDCDGRIDEIAGTSCETGQPGACAMGQLVCTEAGAICSPDATPIDELCNGVDDDCDGETDEDLSGLPCGPEGGCTPTEDGFDCVGTCRTGSTACDGTTLRCDGAVGPVAPEDECTTDGDADCDGAVDEGCPCTEGEERDCYGGPSGTQGMGTCIGGRQTCNGGTWGACVGEVTPSDETCANAGADDDCNGSVDDIPSIGTSCTAEAMGACRQGTFTCLGGVRVCQPGTAAATERCDGVDEDCDGTVDEDQTNCGNTCCNGTCADLDSDPANCGGCLIGCAAGQICSNGGCCSTGQIFCDGACRNPNTNRDHCGDCGVACNDGLAGIGRQECEMGVCR
ncbi:MAG: hypothetical protein H6721_15960 [Sandaracinus sp.]|nr:hypothetical protein [Sandaracinus sp.]MCB9633612.1 hypothetical protein [Sandaracinus sp.]